jgi:hypothetical protein
MISGAVEHPYYAILLNDEEAAVATVSNIEGAGESGCPIGDCQRRLGLHAQGYQQGYNGAVSGHGEDVFANIRETRYLLLIK